MKHSFFWLENLLNHEMINPTDSYLNRKNQLLYIQKLVHDNYFSKQYSLIKPNMANTNTDKLQFIIAWTDHNQGKTCCFLLKQTFQLFFFEFWEATGAALHRCSYKKVFWKYPANLQENTHAEVCWRAAFEATHRSRQILKL